MGLSIEIRLCRDGKPIRSFAAPADQTTRFDLKLHEWERLGDGDTLVAIDVRPTILDAKGAVR